METYRPAGHVDHGIQGREVKEVKLMADQDAEPFVATIEPEQHLKALVAQYKELRRQSQKLFDYSNPVDEYQQGDAGVSLLMWQADYEIPERIETITLSLGVGASQANLKLGERTILLYSGAATTVQTLVNLVGVGFILNRSDPRILTITGATTTPTFVSLAGHCMESGTPGLR